MAENVNTQDTNGVDGVTFSETPAYLSEALNDAERLLKYAAAAGINIDKDIRASILQARAAVSKVWTEETADNLLAAFTKLAALVKPVTADSLKWWEENRQIRRTATATPATSSSSTPLASGSSNPAASSTSTPAASSSSTPGASGGSNPAASGSSTPALSGSSTPAASSGSTPAVSSGSTPATSSGSTPATSSSSNPATSSSSNPATSSSSNPATSGGSTPAPPSGSSQRASSRSTRGLWVLFRKWSERRPYVLVTILLGLTIVPFSVVSFVSSAISGAIQTDIKTANDLAAKLREQLGPLPAVTQAAASTDGPSSASPSSSATPAGSSDATPAGSSSATPARSSSATPAASALLPGVKESEVIAELQQFASSIRDVDGRARQLNRLFLNNVPDPFFEIRGDPTKIRKIFQLPQGLPDLAKAASDRIMVYQEVRYFAQNLLDDVSFYFGACTACILPVLYALFGTCAYLLRSVEQKAYTPPADFARFLIAGIGGAVVGLFNNFSIAQGPSIPPLAIAFLVGYAVDVFFAFLENLLPKK